MLPYIPWQSIWKRVTILWESLWHRVARAFSFLKKPGPKKVGLLRFGPFRPCLLAVRIPDFHSGNRGSNPRTDILLPGPLGDLRQGLYILDREWSPAGLHMVRQGGSIPSSRTGNFGVYPNW